jgi:hypothetical protein
VPVEVGKYCWNVEALATEKEGSLSDIFISFKRKRLKVLHTDWSFIAVMPEKRSTSLVFLQQKIKSSLLFEELVFSPFN